jgi:hypothetical protein
MAPNLIAGLASIVIFIFIFDLLRRGVLKEKYAVLWLLMAGVALFFSVFPWLFDSIAFFLGVSQPVNLLFFLSSVILVLVSVQFSFELSRHEGQIRRLAEEVALLSQQLESRDLNDSPENEK